MTCRTVKVGSAVAIVCSRGERRRRCGCGRWATKLCDARVERRGRRATCDRPMCDRCSTSVGQNIDHCLAHAGAKPEPDLLSPHGGDDQPEGGRGDADTRR